MSFASLWKKIDFFICSGLETNIAKIHKKDLSSEARSVARQYCANLFHWKEALKSSGLSNHSFIYGEIGWRSGEGDIGSLESFEEFWKTLLACSSQNNLDINVFNIVDEVPQLKATSIQTRDTFGGYGILHSHTATYNNTDSQVWSRRQVISEVTSTRIPKFWEPKKISTEESSNPSSPPLSIFSLNNTLSNSSHQRSGEEKNDKNPYFKTIVLVVSFLFTVVFVVSILVGLIYSFNRQSDNNGGSNDKCEDISLDNTCTEPRQKLTVRQVLLYSFIMLVISKSVLFELFNLKFFYVHNLRQKGY